MKDPKIILLALKRVTIVLSEILMPDN